MKRGIFTIVFLVCFSCNVLAVSIDMKESYGAGETMIMEIKGIILTPISQEQISFVRGHVAMPFNYGLTKIGERYFIWGITPRNENNYSIVIEKVFTMVDGATKEIEVKKDFRVEGNASDYYIEPGVISAIDDFEIKAVLSRDEKKTINVDFPYGREIELIPGDNKIEFSIGEINATGIYTINIGKYAMPAYIIKKSSNVKNVTGYDDEEINLRLNPESIESTILMSDTPNYPFQIVNNGSNEVKDIEVIYDKEIFNVNFNGSFSLNGSESIEFNISLREDISTEIKKDGINRVIKIESGEFILKLPVMISFTEKEEEKKTPYLENYTKLEYCSSLGGKICVATETCDSTPKTTIEGLCCVGNCKSPEEEGGNAWISYIIVGVLLIIGVFIFLKYKKTKGTDQFSKRILGAEKKIGKDLP